jgi:SAM-dependent methyltransferase
LAAANVTFSPSISPMTTAFSLIRKVLSCEVPPRALLWGLLNTLNRNLNTGNRRYEFERLYLENADPWGYDSGEYEQDKYRRTLDYIRQWRRDNGSALEIGCSIGVFSGLLSHCFAQCVAIDMSQEALWTAKSRNAGNRNLHFVRGDVRFLNLDRRFDVIVCAEVLYYVDNADAPRVARNLDGHLGQNGIIVSISGVQSNGMDVAHLDPCEQELSGLVEVLHREVIQDPSRPYRIVIFGRSPTAAY